MNPPNMSARFPISNEYRDFIRELKLSIQQAKHRALRSVNGELI